MDVSVTVRAVVGVVLGAPVDESETGVRVEVLAGWVLVGALVDGTTVSATGGAGTVSVGLSGSPEVAVKFGAAAVSVILGAAAVVAHPRRSISSRIAARIRLTTSLKRS
jgi:hypothetical protein